MISAIIAWGIGFGGVGFIATHGFTSAAPPAQIVRSELSVAKKVVNSQLSIRAEITRLKGLPGAPPDRRPGGNEALTGPVSDKQVLGNVLSAIQDSANGINERLAAIEKWQADIDKRLKAAGI